MSRITHKDIASRLGLNQSTVSRALRDDPTIPAETRQRVRAIGEQLGYRVDPWLSELASARWSRDRLSGHSVIAYISSLTSPLQPFVDLPDHIRPQAARLGYQLEVFDRTAFSSSSRLQRVLRARGITEIIFGPVYDQLMDIELDWSKFICIQIFPGIHSLPIHSVIRDQFNVVTLAWRKAVAYGYRRIGIALLDHHFQSVDDIMRLSAVHACQKYLFAHLPSIPVFHFTKENNRARDFVRWVKENHLDAIIDFTQVHAYLLPKLDPQMGYACLHKSGPKEFSGIAGYDEVCGKEAINLLHYCRRSYQWGLPVDRIDHVLEPTWFEGSTMPRKSDAVAA
jgi:LacI family transcriptional regulator